MLSELRKLLYERELTQRELAAAASLSASRLCRILRGVARPRANERLAIAEALAFSTCEMRRYFPPRATRKEAR